MREVAEWERIAPRAGAFATPVSNALLLAGGSQAYFGSATEPFSRLRSVGVGKTCGTPLAGCQH